MPSFRTGRVTEVLGSRPGFQRVATDAGRAFVLTQLTGEVAVGDEVVVNTTAVDLGLGTGGWHVVHWNLARREWSEPGPGHLMKLRYTSLQVDAGAAEELHPDLPADLAGTPVVVGSLHSQLAPIVVALRHLRPDAKVTYVMTDGAALPMVLSDLVHDLRSLDLLHGTITAGHAFGGDLEAINVPSALVLARHVQQADVVVVAMGPGVVGTGSRLGTTALETAAILDGVAALGGRPVAALRMSDGDQRERHRGISHHSTTALELVRSSVIVAAPDGIEVPGASHEVRTADPIDIASLLDAVGLRVTTM
ncbi:MAG: DUF3866 family protein, partial [Actinomycetota bacterium]|nr:DUF3866 family protein [Actinomycetota bacterium]